MPTDATRNRPVQKGAPRLPRHSVYVATAHHTEHELHCARDHGVGVEVQTFSFPAMLNAEIEPAVDKLAKELARVEGPIGTHGAFIDTTHYSADPWIREAARRRYIQSLDIAQRLNAEYVVFHSQYNPVIKVPGYSEMYHEGSMAFWPEVLEEAARRDLRIYIENMFDESPEPIRRVLEAFDDPSFGACIDIAHVAVFSDLGLKTWVDALEPYVRHIHMNDCDGEQDDHMGLGQGALNIKEALELFGRFHRPLGYTLETGLHTAVSLEYLNIARVA